jgi:hypothetical protein
MKHCKKCDVLLELASFKDKSLKSGYGVVCNACKGVRTSKKNKSSHKNYSNQYRGSSQGKLTKTRIDDFEIRNNYQIEYTNLSNSKSTREVLIESVDYSRGTFRAYCFLKGTNLTFRADRAKILKKIK